MPTHAEVAAATQRLQQLHSDYYGALDGTVTIMSGDIWVGGGSDQFASSLSGGRQRMRQALDNALTDARRLLAATPADQPATTAVPRAS